MWILKAILKVVGGIILFFGLVIAGVRSGLITEPTLQSKVARIFSRNFGVVEVAPGIYRGGQPNDFGRDFIEGVYGFGTVINLAWRDSPEDLAERRWFEDRGVAYHRFEWQPDGPPAQVEIDRVMALVETSTKPVYIHCIGGKDRTGGMIGTIELERGRTLDSIRGDWKRYGLPSAGWRAYLEKTATSTPAKW
jgi:hypothetical protein